MFLYMISVTMPGVVPLDIYLLFLMSSYWWKSRFLYIGKILNIGPLSHFFSVFFSIFSRRIHIFRPMNQNKSLSPCTDKAYAKLSVTVVVVAALLRGQIWRRLHHFFFFLFAYPGIGQPSTPFFQRILLESRKMCSRSRFVRGEQNNVGLLVCDLNSPLLTDRTAWCSQDLDGFRRNFSECHETLR